MEKPPCEFQGPTAKVPYVASNMLRPISSALTPALQRISLSAASSSAPKSANLIWDDGFGQQFARSVAVLAVVSAGAAQTAAVQSCLEVLRRLAQRLEWWSLLGLLSSSCCAVQLALNTISFGCAGFNTVLGPLRSHFLALTFCLQGLVWRSAFGTRSYRSALLGTAVAVSLSLLPEVLHAWVHRSRRIERAGATEIELAVDGMGCTACTLKAKEALASVPGVLSCDVVLEEASARVQLTPDQHPNAGTAAVAALETAGFSARVKHGP